MGIEAVSKITPISSNEELDLESALEELTESAQASGLVLFVGAGVSVAAPSSCPTWNQLLDEVLAAATAAHPELRELHDIVKPVVGAFKPELTCHLLHQTVGSDLFPFLDALDSGEPNGNHAAIVALARAGVLRVVITTNFDTHIETAFRVAGIPFRLWTKAVPSASDQHTAGRSDQVTNVVKLHGSLGDRTSLVFTLRHAGRRLDPRKARWLQAALKGSPVLFVGYSGNDDDIFPVVLEAAGQSAARLYWTRWGDDKATPAMSDFASAQGSRIVRVRKTDILPALARMVNGDYSAPVRKVMQGRALLMRGCAESISVASWRRFLCAALMTGSRSRDHARVALDVLSRIEDRPTPLDVAHVERWKGVAASRVGDDQVGFESFETARRIYLRQGAFREALETLVSCIQERPLVQVGLPGRPMTSQATAEITVLAGPRAYDAVSFCLICLAQGIMFLRAGKFGDARDKLVLSFGYAHRSGDRLRAADALQNLLIALHELRDVQQIADCEVTLRKLESQLGMHRTTVHAGARPGALGDEARLLKRAESAVRRSLLRIALAEVALFASIWAATALFVRFTGHGWALGIFFTLGRLHLMARRYWRPPIERV